MSGLEVYIYISSVLRRSLKLRTQGANLGKTPRGGKEEKTRKPELVCPETKFTSISNY